MEITNKTEVVRTHTYTITLTDAEEVSLINALDDAGGAWRTDSPAWQLVVELARARDTRAEESR